MIKPYLMSLSVSHFHYMSFEKVWLRSKVSLSITFMAPGPAPMLWSGTWGSEVGCPLQSSLSTVISSLVMGGLLDLEGGFLLYTWTFNKYFIKQQQNAYIWSLKMIKLPENINKDPPPRANKNILRTPLEKILMRACVVIWLKKNLQCNVKIVFKRLIIHSLRWNVLFPSEEKQVTQWSKINNTLLLYTCNNIYTGITSLTFVISIIKFLILFNPSAEEFPNSSK